jgi:hypothetical protein
MTRLRQGYGGQARRERRERGEPLSPALSPPSGAREPSGRGDTEG